MKTFLRPNFRKLHYGSLERLAAIEPPVHMLQRAVGHSFADMEVDMTIPNGTSEIVLCPHGNHPSAIFENVKACKELKFDCKTSILDKHVNMDTRIPYSMLPLKKYRAHNWHMMTARTEGYATTYLSTSCKFNCKFCFVKSYYGRYWERSLEHVISDLDYLCLKGIYNVKMLDEIFLSDTPRFNRFLDEASIYGENMNIWGYARIDGIKENIVKKARKAGVRWLAVGVESGSQRLRQGMNKGKFTNEDIRTAVKICEDNGVQVLANYIVSLEGETPEELQETKKLAFELNTAFMNVYSYVDYKSNITDPRSGIARKRFFKEYFTRPEYTAKIKSLFGDKGLTIINDMLGAK